MAARFSKEQHNLPEHISEALIQKRNDIMAQLDDEGFKLIEIAHVFRISPQRVYQIVNEYRNAKSKLG